MLRKEATYIFAGSLGISDSNPQQPAVGRKKTCTTANADAKIDAQVTLTSLQSSISRRFVWRHCDCRSLEKISADGITSSNHSSPAIGTIFYLLAYK
jgi:hypothetical protein